MPIPRSCPRDRAIAILEQLLTTVLPQLKESEEFNRLAKTVLGEEIEQRRNLRARRLEDTADMTPARDQTVELLHALGHLYARHSQPKRGLVLLLIAARLAPNDEGVLRTLAEAFLRSRSPQAAAEVIDRLQALGDTNQPMLDLLRSRALWLAGNESEAKRMFRKFLEHRERS